MKKLIIINSIFIAITLIGNVLFYKYFIKCNIKEKNTLSVKEDKKYLDKLRRGVLYNDNSLFIEGAGYGIIYGNREQTGYYSLVMALQYDNLTAYNFLYSLLNDRNDSASVVMDNFKLFLLAKSYELGRNLSSYDMKLISNEEGKICHSNVFLERMKTTAN